MKDRYGFVVKCVNDDDIFEKFDQACKRMNQAFTDAFALAVGVLPVDAIAHRMGRD